MFFTNCFDYLHYESGSRLLCTTRPGTNVGDVCLNERTHIHTHTHTHMHTHTRTHTYTHTHTHTHRHTLLFKIYITYLACLKIKINLKNDKSATFNMSMGRDIAQWYCPHVMSLGLIAYSEPTGLYHVTPLI